MFEKAEQEYKDLVRKRDIIEKDKTKIEQVITELDRKKNEALEATWQKVTKVTSLPRSMGAVRMPSS